MIIEDDRTSEEKNTHRYLVVMTDRFLSGWGKAEGGKSYAAWACDGPRTAYRVEEQIIQRSDALRVRIVYDGPTRHYRPRTKGHLHIYVVNEDSPYEACMA